MIKEFESEQAMKDYESKREQFYVQQLEEIDRCSLNFYKQLLKYIFLPSYRAKEKEYKSYEGGYWRDGRHRICSSNLCCLKMIEDTPEEEGNIAIHREGDCIYGIYVWINNCWQQVNLNESDQFLIEKG